MADLDGRVVAIAGAAGGLGPIVADRLAAAGATLALTDRSEEHLDSLRARLGLPEERLDTQVADLLDPAATAAWASSLDDRFGSTDALLHLVGGWRGGEPIETASLEDYEFLHDLLVRTVQHTSRAFHGPLSASEHGRFVLVSSSQAQHPSSTNASYAAAKAAAEAWTLALADSFAGTSATANILVVNAILTPAMLESDPDADKPDLTPAEHIADALAFICSDSAARMNGQRLSLHP